MVVYFLGGGGEGYMGDPYSPENKYPVFGRMVLGGELRVLLLQVQILIQQLHASSLFYDTLYLQVLILSRMLRPTALLPVPTSF